MFEGPTKEEIKKGNKLITEFLDWELVNIGDIEEENSDFHCWVFKNKRTGQMHDGIDAEIFGKDSTIPFNESWKWLMSAVERIEDMQIRVTISTTFVRIHTGGENIELNCEVFGGKLNAAWSAIIEFVKQYNKK